jgi:hypothetical protein
MKKLVLLAAVVASTSVFASVTSSTGIDGVYKGKQNIPMDIFSGHSYVISNDSGKIQTVQVCYATIVCAEYPQRTKKLQSCDSMTLQIGETRSGSKVQDLKATFDAYGWCKTYAGTQIYGWQTNVSHADGKLRIDP